MFSALRPVSSTIIEKIIVVAPTTAVPISTGFAVALNVLPAPSFSSRKCLACSKFGSEAEVSLDFFLNVGDLSQSARIRKRTARCRSPGHRNRLRS